MFSKALNNLRSKQLINNKIFEHAKQIYWALGVGKWNANFIFDFLENEFWADRGVPFKFHFQKLTWFLDGIFSVHRGMLELKNDTSISRKNGSFANKTCCSLPALFVKMKIYVCCCNFGNKQKFLISLFCIDCSQ